MVDLAVYLQSNINMWAYIAFLSYTYLHIYCKCWKGTTSCQLVFRQSAEVPQCGQELGWNPSGILVMSCSRKLDLILNKMDLIEIIWLLWMTSTKLKSLVCMQPWLNFLAKVLLPQRFIWKLKLEYNLILKICMTYSSPSYTSYLITIDQFWSC